MLESLRGTAGDGDDREGMNATPISKGSEWRFSGSSRIREAALAIGSIAKTGVTGKPFNIASYALLTHMVAQVTGLEPGDFVHSFGDVHLYANHFEQARLQLTRAPRPLPRLVVNPERRRLEDFVFEDFSFEGYDPHPHIKAEVSV